MQVLLLDALPGRGIARISALLWFPPPPQFPLLSAAARAPLYTPGEDPSGRRYSTHPHTHTHVETSHERDLTATRRHTTHLKFVDLGQFSFLSRATRQTLITPSHVSFPRNVYLLPHIITLIRLHLPRTYYHSLVKKVVKTQQRVPRNKFIEKNYLSDDVVTIIIIIIIIIIVPFFRSYISHGKNFKRVTKRILFSDPIQTNLFCVTDFARSTEVDLTPVSTVARNLHTHKRIIIVFKGQNNFTDDSLLSRFGDARLAPRGVHVGESHGANR
jgi:hypothetical protein